MSSNGFVCDPVFFTKLKGDAPSVTMVFKNVVRYDDDIILVVEHELLVSESDIRRRK